MEQTEVNPSLLTQKQETVSPPAASPGQTPPVLEKKKTKKFIFLIVSVIVFVLLICAGILGTYYYYLEIARPPQDAKGIFRLYEDLKSFEQLLGGDKVQDATDYKNALYIIDKREEFLLRTQERLLEAKLIKNVLSESLSPRAHKVEKTYQSFSSLIELAIKVNAAAKKEALFWQDTLEILTALGRYGRVVQEQREALLDPRQPRSAGSLLADWEKRIAKAKGIGSNFFAKEPPQFSQVDFPQLEASWEEALRGFEDILGYLRSQELNAPLTSQSVVPEPQTEAEKQQFAGIEKVNQFITLLDSLLGANSAQNILAYRFYGFTSQEDFGAIASEVEKEILKLQKLWPKKDQSKRTETPVQVP